MRIARTRARPLSEQGPHCESLNLCCKEVQIAAQRPLNRKRNRTARSHAFGAFLSGLQILKKGEFLDNERTLPYLPCCMRRWNPGARFLTELPVRKESTSEIHSPAFFHSTSTFLKVLSFKYHKPIIAFSFIKPSNEARGK